MIEALNGIHGLLFDLDGTLIDTAPDMVAALNALRESEGLAPMPFESLRNVVSQGAIGLVRAGMPATDDDEEFESWRRSFLDRYAACLCRDSRLFDGMDEVLAAAERRQVAWGVVTNKPRALAEPLLEALELAARMACLVAGDDLPRRKPHPDPVIEACRVAGLAVRDTVYVGDAENDVLSARAAGCRGAVIAAYGYIAPPADPTRWGGQATIERPADLLDLLFPGQ